MSVLTLERKGPAATAQHAPGAPADIQMKRAGGSGIVEADEETGLVTAIVSVTGVKDEVDDIIMPGAYAESLKKRTPKGVWSHDWNLWAARTESVEEILPGDPRLPTLTRAGKTWPKEAGVLLVKARYNLETQQGREAFSNVKFFADECEWSIGYTVMPGKSSRDARGVRMIKQIELFEFSPVLFGAMPLAGTLAVKSRQAAVAAVADEDAFDDDDEALIDGLSTDLSGFATVDDDEAIDALAGQVKGSGASLNRSPRSNWVEETGDLPRYIREVARSIEKKRGIPLDKAIPIAIGVIRKWAAGGDDVKAATVAKAARALAAWEALKAKNRSRMAGKKGGHSLFEDWSPEAETGPAAGSAPPVSTAPAGDLTLSVKSYPRLAGSEEERRDAIERAVTDRLREHMKEMRKGKPKAKGDSETSGREDNCYVSIEGTFADRVVASIVDWSIEPSDRHTFSLTYVVGDDLSVIVGDPQPVEMVVTVDVQKIEENVQRTGGTVEYGEYAGVAMKALQAVQEAKAGRVLSSTNEQRLRAAVEHLVAVLRAAGVPIGEGDPDAPETLTDPDTTAQPAQPATAGEPVLVKGSVRLDPAQVKALTFGLDAAAIAARA